MARPEYTREKIDQSCSTHHEEENRHSSGQFAMFKQELVTSTPQTLDFLYLYGLWVIVNKLHCKNVVGKWLVDGLQMVGKWSVGGWQVVGKWSVFIAQVTSTLTMTCHTALFMWTQHIVGAGLSSYRLRTIQVTVSQVHLPTKGGGICEGPETRDRFGT